MTVYVTPESVTTGVAGYSSTIRRVCSIDPATGLAVIQSYPKYEVNTLSPGAGATDYDSKVTGSAFAIVTTAADITITNNDASHAISVKLNASTNGAIPIAASTSVTISKYLVTDVFITTIAGHSGTIKLTMFGV